MWIALDMARQLIDENLLRVHYGEGKKQQNKIPEYNPPKQQFSYLVDLSFVFFLHLGNKLVLSNPVIHIQEASKFRR